MDEKEDTAWILETPAAPWTPRDSMGHVVYDGKMWILGGFIPQRVNDVWSSSNGKTWTEATSEAPWAVRNLPNCVVFDDKMWIMAGGSYVDNQIGNDQIAYNDVWSSTDGANWELATDNAAWSPRSAATVIVFDDRMWIMGGMAWGNGRQPSHDVWCSDNGKDWTLATDYAPWCARSMQTSVVFDGKMWVIGGGVYDESVYANSPINFQDVWCSTDGVDWQEITGGAAWPPRRFHRSVVFDDRIWVIGGSHYGNRRDVWHSTDGADWQREGEAEWSVRHEPGALVFDDRIWIIGGFGKTLYNDVWSYRPQAGSER